MRNSLRLSAAIGAGAAVAFFSIALALSGTFSGTPTKAWAVENININPGNVPTTAEGFDHECDPNQGGGPLAGQDIWVFVLPGQHATAGDFVSITAFFDGHPSQTITAAGDPDQFINGGPQASKGWIITPEGWTLTGATAIITGTANFFNLTHTCPAASPSPSVSPSPSRTVGPPPPPPSSPPASPSMSASTSPSMSPSASSSPSRTVGPPPPPPSSPPASHSPSTRPSHSRRPYGGTYGQPGQSQQSQSRGWTFWPFW